MSDLLAEVLNEEKEEKRLIFFRKILPVIIILSILGAIATGAYNWYYNRKLRHDQAMGDILVQLTLENITDHSLINNSLIEIIQHSQNHQQELAKIKLINIKIAKNDITGALSDLEQVINNKHYHSLTISYARLIWLSLILDKADLSTSDKTQAEDYLQYCSDPQKEFYLTGTLLKSLFYYKTNRFDLAKEYAMQIINNPAAPGVAKEQAQGVLTNLR